MNLEVLLSTMYQTNLGFLDAMFVNNKIEDILVLIINQTTEDKILKSDKPNIRVINVFDKGSPSSRNLAIDNAIGDVCLFADDDIEYLPELKQKVLETYALCPKADILTFEAVDADNKRYMSYPDHEIHTKKSLFKVNNIGISFRRSSIQSTKIRYNPYFGVGAKFPGNTEYLFLRKAFDHNKILKHKNIFLSKHCAISSGKQMGSDNGITARSALRYRLYGWLSVPWLLKYVIFMVKYKYIQPSQFFDKFKVGMKAILDYRQLVKEGKMV